MKNKKFFFLCMVFLCIVYSAFAFDISMGINVAWGGQNLLTGGPMVGMGIGLIADYRTDHESRLLLTAGTTFFFPSDERINGNVVVHVNLDAMYELIRFDHFLFSTGAGFVYDILLNDQYGVNELSVEMLTRISFPFGAFEPFISAKLELGGFDTYILAVGLMYNSLLSDSIVP